MFDYFLMHNFYSIHAVKKLELSWKWSYVCFAFDSLFFCH